MKKVFALLLVVLIVVFGNYQIYAQVLCHDSKCCGCCPPDSFGLSPCKCDVGNDSADDYPQSVSAVAVSNVLIRLYYSPVVLHTPVLAIVNSGSVDIQKFKPDVSTVSLTISSFQIPLRI
ncbi:MAG: hypothetical protein ACM31E_08175 [Fibrobacterota bacterium]|nr:hypothetical protein [Chitinispirillaceae bacterium]